MREWERGKEEAGEVGEEKAVGMDFIGGVEVEISVSLGIGVELNRLWIGFCSDLEARIYFSTGK